MKNFLVEKALNLNNYAFVSSEETIHIVAHHHLGIHLEKFYQVAQKDSKDEILHVMTSSVAEVLP